MPRTAAKARPPTPSRAAARPVDATAQEADEAPMTKAKVPVTYSRKKKSPAASEAAAATAAAAAAAAAAAVTGTLYQSNLWMQATLLMKPLPLCVNNTFLHAALYKCGLTVQ